MKIARLHGKLVLIVNILLYKLECNLAHGKVEGIRLVPDLKAMEDDGIAEEFVPAAGVFVAVGTAGSSEIARQMGAELTEKGHIKVNEKMETTIPGLFAAGDCTGGLLQIAKAVYEGSQAGISAIQYVRSRHKDDQN